MMSMSYTILLYVYVFDPVRIFLEVYYSKQQAIDYIKDLKFLFDFI